MNRNSKLVRGVALAATLVAATVGAKMARHRRAPASSSAQTPHPSASVAASASASADAPLSRTPRSHVNAPGLAVESGTIQGETLWGYTELTLDLRLTRLAIVSAEHGAPLERLLPASALALVNGGYFEASYRPSAWLRDRGLDLAPRLAVSKGGVLALRGAEVFVGPLAALRFDPELAVQSFPLIVEADGSLGIHSNDGRRAARTVVCLNGGALRFIVISAVRGEGPTLFESAPLLRAPAPAGFGCGVALNLDGGPSTGVCFGKAVPARSRLPLAPVAYGIAVLPQP